MKYLYLNFIKQRSLSDKSLFLFQLGIFFLPSSLFIGMLFLLPAAALGSILQKKNFFKDSWNLPFIIFGVLILINSFLQYFILKNNYQDIWHPLSSIIGMGNWLPFIWFFWAFQPYLDSKLKRKSLCLILIASTFPVLISGFGQYYFNWHGPFKTLNGLIIWYQRPIIEPAGLSGLFNNQNYTGSWLNFVWPFCLALFLEHKNKFFKKTISFLFVISVGWAAFLTYSRNAWLGLLITTPIIIGKKGIRFFLAIIILVIFAILFFKSSAIYIDEFQKIIINIIPKNFVLEFTEEGYKELDVSRMEIYSSAISLIKTSPIFGIGSSSFTEIYLLETNFWKGHAHNLLLELAISYGLPVTIILFITVNIILFYSGKEIFISRNFYNINLFDKAIWAALLFFLISQLADIQYFDGKISLVAWILLSSLKNIIEEKNKPLILENK